MMARRSSSMHPALLTASCLLTSAFWGLLCATLTEADSWTTHGGSELNQRWAKTETKISVTTAPTFDVSWAFNTTGDVSATPAVYGGVVYFPDWGGMIFAVSQFSGALIWKKNLTSDYGFPKNNFNKLSYSRTTPAIAPASPGGLTQDLLIYGLTNPAIAFAVSRATGALVWQTTVDPHPAALITGGGTVYSGGFYVGVASNEESLAIGSYECCTFRGSLLKLSTQTGAIVWQFWTLQDNGGQPGGYSGSGIWAATPSIDAARKLVFTGVGNYYTAPAAVEACENARTTSPDYCLDPGNYFDAIIALDIITGQLKWFQSLNPYDAWNAACLLPKPGVNCPPSPGPDYDFGMSPLLLTIKPNAKTPKVSVDVAIVGQKSGMTWALNRQTGAIVWKTISGPGGILGGSAWGLATDGVRVYVGMENSDAHDWVLAPGTATTKSGGWQALDANTGKILWSVKNAAPTTAMGMIPTVANGVLLVGSPDPAGWVYALNAATGAYLWKYQTGYSIYGGFAVDQGCVFVGRGYVSLHSLLQTTGGGPQKLYSFCVYPGRKFPPPLRSPPPRKSPPPLRSPPPLKSPPPRKSPPPLASPPPFTYVPKTVEVGGTLGWILNVNRTWTPPRLFVGDKLLFTWPTQDGVEEDHNVYRFTRQTAYESCNFDYSVELSGESGYVYTLNQAGVIFFGCEEADHCALKQKLALLVEPVPTTYPKNPSPPPPAVVAASPPPAVGTASPPPPSGGSTGGQTIPIGGTTYGWDLGLNNPASTGWPIPTVNAGDKLFFKWTNFHDVWVLPSKAAFDACDFSGGTQLAGGSNVGTYTYGPIDNSKKGTTLYFGCGVGYHCKADQKVAIPVAN